MKKAKQKQIITLIESLKADLMNEKTMIEYNIVLLQLLVEIRDLLKSQKCKCSNLQTDPLKLKKDDILIGEK